MGYATDTSNLHQGIYFVNRATDLVSLRTSFTPDESKTRQCRHTLPLPHPTVLSLVTVSGGYGTTPRLHLPLRALLHRRKNFRTPYVSVSWSVPAPSRSVTETETEGSNRGRGRGSVLCGSF